MKTWFFSTKKEKHWNTNQMKWFDFKKLPIYWRNIRSPKVCSPTNARSHSISLNKYSIERRMWFHRIYFKTRKRIAFHTNWEIWAFNAKKPWIFTTILAQTDLMLLFFYKQVKKSGPNPIQIKDCAFVCDSNLHRLFCTIIFCVPFKLVLTKCSNISLCSN